MAKNNREIDLSSNVDLKFFQNNGSAAKQCSFCKAYVTVEGFKKMTPKERMFHCLGRCMGEDGCELGPY